MPILTIAEFIDKIKNYPLSQETTSFIILGFMIYFVAFLWWIFNGGAWWS